MEMSRSAAQIVSGGMFDVFDPKIDDIRLDDIAHALAMTCRFNGHSSRFYSVAEHSVHVSRVAETLTAGAGKRGVLHDGHEAYAGDMIYPLKHSGMFDDFLLLEDSLEKLVLARFAALDPQYEEAVHHADMAMVQIERLHLFPRTPEADDAWAQHEGDPTLVPDYCLPQCWQPDLAKVLFLERCKEVGL